MGAKGLHVDKGRGRNKPHCQHPPRLEARHGHRSLRACLRINRPGKKAKCRRGWSAGGSFAGEGSLRGVAARLSAERTLAWPALTSSVPCSGALLASVSWGLRGPGRRPLQSRSWCCPRGSVASRPQTLSVSGPHVLFHTLRSGDAEGVSSGTRLCAMSLVPSTWHLPLLVCWFVLDTSMTLSSDCALSMCIRM